MMSRYPAKRVFASEFQDATEMYRDGDEETSPKLLVLPTGEEANRVLIAGTITEVEDVGSEEEYLRARIVDPTGPFLVYAGRYREDCKETLKDVSPPEFVAVLGKPDVYENNGSKISSLKPEWIKTVDSSFVDKWVSETCENTLERIQKDGLESVRKAEEFYGDRFGYVDMIRDVVLRI